MMEYQILDWDTKFFGVKVAKIVVPDLNQEQLREILSVLDRNGVKLVYWSSDKEISGNEAKNLRGCLVDRKTTFEVALHSLNPRNFVSTDIVEKYNSSMSAAQLETLSIQSGEYSRYSVDQMIQRNKFEKLYKIWLRRSLNKEIADEVLVIIDGGSVAGMVTLGSKNGKGDIRLLGVGSEYRGRKYGEILVRAAQDWFIRNGYKIGQVVTQGDNIPACNLYEKCGYSTNKIEYFYHFWL